MAAVEDPTLVAGGAETPPAAPVENGGDGGWKTDKQGRQYAPARGRSGVVYRQGNESLDEAYARDGQGPKDRKPRGKARAKLPPQPTGIDARQLEHALSELLQSPGFAAAMAGDQWLADHFAKQGPTLARNLVAASERNPWLRQKLEALMMGDDFMVRLMTLVPLVGAVIAYTAPPVLYLLPIHGDRVDRAREMFSVPERPSKEEESPRADAAPAAPPAPPESTPAPAAA